MWKALELVFTSVCRLVGHRRHGRCRWGQRRTHANTQKTLINLNSERESSFFCTMIAGTTTRRTLKVFSGPSHPPQLVRKSRQFGIYDYFRKQLIRRKRDDGEGDGLLRDGLLPPSVRRRLGLGNDGRGGDDSDDDVARKLYLLEEELL